MSAGQESRLARLERNAPDPTDLKNLSHKELRDRQKAILVKVLIGPGATAEERQAAMKRLDIEDEFQMALVEAFAATLASHEHQADYRWHIINAKAKVDQHLRYWTQASGADAVRAQQPGFDPPLFSWEGHEQDTPEGFSRRREMRKRLAVIVANLPTATEQAGAR